MYTRKMKLNNYGGNVRLTIPRELARHFNIGDGDQLILTCENGKLVVDLTNVERFKPFNPADVSPKAVEAA
jgi:hypothetical protein